MQKSATGFAVELLKCPTCQQTDTITVMYTCLLCSHTEILPPKPTGHPMHRKCPDPTESGCTGQQTGVILSCTAELLKCSTCGKTNTVTVRYACPHCGHSETLPPRPDGHPMHRKCPDPTDSGCSAKETGAVVSCTCSNAGLTRS